MTRLIHFSLLVLLAIAGCNRQEGQPFSPVQNKKQEGVTSTLLAARKGFQTKLVPGESAKEPVLDPPPKLFRLVRYDASAGALAAYLSPDPKDGKKHPAIIWITGGDCNSIGNVWENAPDSNDQTAAAYRNAGIVMMFPSLRGGNDNPGAKEGFLGEVDDVLAAADFLAKQNYVDPARIYLGGHSTGGTLALIAAECSDRFRAFFSFGPVNDVGGYSPEFLPFDTSDIRELELRSPGQWLASIRVPTFVFEGTLKINNIASLQAMARSSSNPKVHFFEVRGADHFSILAPTNRLIADKILRDKGRVCNLSFAAEVLSKPFAK
jgi:dienelactone hydrolase